MERTANDPFLMAHKARRHAASVHICDLMLFLLDTSNDWINVEPWKKNILFFFS